MPWVTGSLPAGETAFNVRCVNDVFVVFASSIWRLDAETLVWSEISIPAPPSGGVGNDWVDVAYGNGVYVFVSFYRDYAYTSDLESFTTGTMSGGADFPQAAVGAIAFGGGVFCVITQNRDITWTSPNGVSWTTGGTNFIDVANRLCLVHTGAVFIACSSNAATDAASYSTNGLTWSHTSEGVSGALFTTEGGTTFTYRNGVVWVSHDDAASWNELDYSFVSNMSVSSYGFTSGATGSAGTVVAAVNPMGTQDNGQTWFPIDLPDSFPSPLMVAATGSAYLFTTETEFAFGTPAPGGVEVPNNTTISGLQGMRSKLFYVDIPGNAATLTVSTTGGTGDVDLYMSRNAYPDAEAAHSYEVGNDEEITLAPPQYGRYFILLDRYEDYDGVSLSASYTLKPVFWTGRQGCDEVYAS